MLVLKNSFVIAVSFITILPFKNYPEWNKDNLRFFCVMLPLVGFILAILWLIFFYLLLKIPVSGNLKGILMTIFVIFLTGGLHMDGLIDTCDAYFSRFDVEKRLEILSDTHTGSFGVMGCVIILILKSVLFSEIFLSISKENSLEKIFLIFLIPVYSRLGMGILLNNLNFAKNDGLAKLLGSSRKSSDNIFFMILAFFMIFFNFIIFLSWLIIFISWSKFCKRNFNGITGDLLGAFVEISEVIILISVVFLNCIS